MSVASNISFPTILCMLELKVLWQLEQGGLKCQKNELLIRVQHNISSHFVMVSTLIFSTSFGTN